MLAELTMTVYASMILSDIVIFFNFVGKCLNNIRWIITKKENRSLGPTLNDFS